MQEEADETAENNKNKKTKLNKTDFLVSPYQHQYLITSQPVPVSCYTHTQTTHAHYWCKRDVTTMSTIEQNMQAEGGPAEGGGIVRSSDMF